MKDLVINGFQRGLRIAHKLVEDIPDDQMCSFSGPLVNHPAWQLGHLTASCDAACVHLGGDSKLPSGWDELFDMGSTPSEDACGYPPRQELLAALTSGHEQLARLFSAATDEQLAQPMPEQQRAFFSTAGDFVYFLMTGHEGYHHGQLSAWRRNRGMGSIL